MAKVIAVTNQKGGVGKSTTVSNLGIGLSNLGYKVLTIDLDSQGSLTASLGFPHPDKLENTIATIMTNIINEKPFGWDDGIIHHDEGIDLMPGNIELSGLEVSLVNVMGREMVLKEYIETVREHYDYILIDCMPSLGMLTINALACADTTLIPVQAAYLPVKGLEQLLKTIFKVKRQINSLIAHRLKTVRNADRILVLNQGRIVQQGRHEELIQQEGIYKRFVESRELAASWKL